MPELPDVEIYVERLNAMLANQILTATRLQSIFLLRTVEPSLNDLQGKRLVGVSRLGKRIVLEFEQQLFAVIHLMIAGRLRLKKVNAPLPKGNGLIAFDFPSGSLIFTEAGKKRRASLHLVRGYDELQQFDRGGMEVLAATESEFAERLCRDNHTLKRALTDPRIFSGIGNAYSDEILHRAQLSPFKQTRSISAAETSALFSATVETLELWTKVVREEVGDGFPDKVTAFKDGMAVHGRYKQPCPVCSAPVQRIVYAQNEANYCAKCQTGGKVLADRALSRLLKDNWPKTIEELENSKR